MGKNMKPKFLFKYLTILILLVAVSAFAQKKKIRVACIGNSITAGYGIKDSTKFYPYQLGVLLGKNY